MKPTALAERHMSYRLGIDRCEKRVSSVFGILNKRWSLTVGNRRLEAGLAGRTEAADRTVTADRTGRHSLAAGVAAGNPAADRIDRRSPAEAGSSLGRTEAAGRSRPGRSWNPGRTAGPGEGSHPGCSRILTS